jgi:hypothetical protein
VARERWYVALSHICRAKWLTFVGAHTGLERYYANFVAHGVTTENFVNVQLSDYDKLGNAVTISSCRLHASFDALFPSQVYQSCPIVPNSLSSCKW